METESYESWGKQFCADAAEHKTFDVSDRDRAYFILPERDYEVQLIVITALINQNKDADARTTAAIKEADEYARKHTGVQTSGESMSGLICSTAQRMKVRRTAWRRLA